MALLTLEELDRFGSLDDLPFTLDANWMDCGIQGPFSLEELDYFSTSIDALAFSLDDAIWTSPDTEICLVYQPQLITGTGTVNATAEFFKDAQAIITANGQVVAAGIVQRTVQGAIDSAGAVSSDATRVREPVNYQANYSTFGNAQLSTLTSNFGPSSLKLDGVGDYIKSPSNILFSSSNYTIEFWVRPESSSFTSYLFDQRPIAGIEIRSVGTTFSVLFGGITLISASNVFPVAQTWYHIAVSRQSTNTRCFINGVQVGSTFSGSYGGLNQPIYIGATYQGTSSFNGYIDEFRLSNTARYTSNFTPPGSAFVSDSSTIALLHFDGANASTSIENSTPLPQSISGVGTASANGDRIRIASSFITGVGFVNAAANSIVSPSATITAVGSATALADRIRTVVGDITASGTASADAVRLRIVDGAITAEGFLAANAGFEFDVNADVVATGTLDALAGIIYTVSGQVASNGYVTCAIYKYGEEWVLVPDQSDIWTQATTQSDIWTQASASSDTWTPVTTQSDVWTQQSSGSNTWQRLA
jgi:hypothetical protein